MKAAFQITAMLVATSLAGLGVALFPIGASSESTARLGPAPQISVAPLVTTRTGALVRN